MRTEDDRLNFASAGMSSPSAPPKHAPGLEPGDGARAARVAEERGKSFARLLRDVVDETRCLIQNEVRLARVETKEMLSVVQRNLTTIGIGAALGLGAVMALVLAGNGAMAALLLELGVLPEVTVWVAPLVVAVVFGLIAWALVKKGANAIRERGLFPKQTANSLKEDKEWLRRRVS